MTENTDWASAIAILAAGLVLGAMFVYFFARRRTASPPVDSELRDLEARRDLLVEQLRAEVSPEERTRLELETAQVLRALDAHKSQVREGQPSRPEPESVARRKAALIGFAWGAGSVLVLGGLGYFVMQVAEPREPTAEQGGMQQQQQPPPADPMVARLEGIVQQSPDNLQARVDLAQAYLERDHLMGVFEQTQYVLAKSPSDARALTYQALVRMAMGQQSEAAQMLRQATKADPMLLDAWLGLAWVHTQGGQPKEAEAAMAEAIRRRPEEKQRLEEVLSQMKAQVNRGSTGQMAGGLPPDHPPIAPPPTAGSAVSSRSVRITLKLDPSARTKSGVIYVIARPEGVSAGPPVAVKRLAADSLPVTFDLTPADSMLGQPLPPRMRIEARLDSDGDAATRTPGDPAGAQDSVVAGSAITLALK